MARTRAERRHNTYFKTSARKVKARRIENDQWPAYGYCGGKITLGGEARSCPLCRTDAQCERRDHQHYFDLQIDSFMKAREARDEKPKRTRNIN